MVISKVQSSHRHLHDQSFTEEIKDYSHQPGGYISVTCLSIAKEAQALGVGEETIKDSERGRFRT